MSIKAHWQLVKAAAISWVDDYAPSMGAALAYYTMFSIAPLLLIVISVAGLAFGEEAARGEIFEQLRTLMGEDSAKAIEGLVESVNKPAQSVLATIAGIGALLIGATTVFGELQNALDRIWRAPARDRAGGLWAMVRTRLLSFGMILGLGFLMIVSLIFSAAVSALGKMWAPMVEGWATLAQALNFALTFALVTVVFAMIYKLMPRVHIAWRDVWVGAAVTSLLFAIGKFLIGLYIGRSGVTSGFGAAASLAVMLVWVYYSAQIFLMGAEYTWVYAHTFGSRKGEPRPGAPTANPTRSGESVSADAAQAAEEARRLAPGGSPLAAPRARID